MTAYLAPQGLHGLRFAAHGFLAAQGLHGFFAAHGLQRLAAHGLHAFFLAAQGLQGLHAAICTTSDAAWDCAVGNAMPATAATAPSAAIEVFKLEIVVFFIVVSMFSPGRFGSVPRLRRWVRGVTAG